MPVVSMFYGIIVRMFYKDNKEHSKPHIHVEYQGDIAVIEIPNGEVLAGKIPPNKLRLIQAWVELHQDELMADWALALEGQDIFKIDALR